MSWDWHIEVEEDENGRVESAFEWGENVWIDEGTDDKIDVEVEIQVSDVDAWMYLYPTDDEGGWPSIENPLGADDMDEAIQETQQILNSLPEFYHDVAW